MKTKALDKIKEHLETLDLEGVELNMPIEEDGGEELIDE